MLNITQELRSYLQHVLNSTHVCNLHRQSPCAAGQGHVMMERLKWRGDTAPGARYSHLAKAIALQAKTDEPVK